MKSFVKRLAATGAVFALLIGPAAAQTLTPDLGAGLSERIIQIFLTVTVLSLAPGIAMMATSLPFIVIALSIMRQGLGLQHAPPNMLIMGLALFLTFFVMEPVFAEAWSAGLEPLARKELTEKEAFEKTLAPFKAFMSARIESEALSTLAEARGLDAGALAQPDLALLVPSFILSEIQRAFEVGFVILLPFLIIDLIVASVLMAMGMLMVPPSIVSLPFKLSFFIMTNGWVAVSGALVRSYA
ncbi:MAG TPA: flagellar biosynthetic protein FliP [Parvularcula sp.]|nr:flagellar biosynthetic protein FliP [Parvularcula sp.]HBS32824.1 flagellar biosynthetic protein FliP [Parvularcula sp.]HBS34328.1 flagellar biosynthetic protein FliP [Parvularcula sp.]